MEEFDMHFVLIIILLGIIGFIFKSVARTPNSGTDETAAEGTPYRKRTYFFSKAERSFFDVLTLISKENNYYLFAKVRLADLLSIERGTKERQKYFNKIAAKHIDFLICDQKYIKPLIAIELDDSSHQTKNRTMRDDFVVTAMAKAGLPLMRVSVRSAYNVNEIKQQINSLLSGI
jgi:hypothetical protein